MHLDPDLHRGAALLGDAAVLGRLQGRLLVPADRNLAGASLADPGGRQDDATGDHCHCEACEHRVHANFLAQSLRPEHGQRKRQWSPREPRPLSVTLEEVVVLVLIVDVSTVVVVVVVVVDVADVTETTVAVSVVVIEVPVIVVLDVTVVGSGGSNVIVEPHTATGPGFANLSSCRFVSISSATLFSNSAEFSCGPISEAAPRDVKISLDMSVKGWLSTASWHT